MRGALRDRRALLAAALAALALLAVAPGCIRVGAGGPPPEDRTYDLLPPLAKGPPPPAAGPEVLEVERFTADVALDREEIVWRRGEVESGAYPHHRWARPPAEAARALVADALARAGVAAVVSTDPVPPSPDFVLRAHLVRCEELDQGDKWTGAVELRAVLVRGATGEEVLRRTYAAEKPAARRNPGEVVAALGKALRELAAAMAKDVGEALARERDRPHDR